MAGVKYMSNESGVPALRALKLGESISRSRRFDVRKYTAAEADAYARSQQNTLSVAATRLPDNRYVTERVEAITRDREHIIVTVVCTRVE